jgi:tryptophan 2,3-dioxygenase
VELVKKAEEEKSLLQLVNNWLERMPFFDDEKIWKDFKVNEAVKGIHPFWAEYMYQYKNSLADAEKNNSELFSDMFLKSGNDPQRTFSPKASRAALFIMLYRGYPLLHLPFQLLSALLDIDELLSSWRYRHMNMVHRMIGTRIGTGGSSGKDYLKAAADKHYIFRDIAQLTSFLIERRKLPQLPQEVESKLGFES